MEKETHLRNLKNECDLSLDKVVVVLNTFGIYANTAYLFLDINKLRS